MAQLNKLNPEDLNAVSGGQDLEAERYQYYIDIARNTYDQYRARGYFAPDAFNKMVETLNGYRDMIRGEGVSYDEMADVIQKIAAEAVRQSELGL